MSRFDFIRMPIPGLTLVQRKIIQDYRGFFSRFYCAEEFQGAGFPKPIMQINQCYSRNKGAVRGLHFQYSPYAECKIVSCVQGEIFDVAVDVRQGSPTFLHWHGEILSATNRRSMIVPEGFAHGFQALSEDCELIYLSTAPYVQVAEDALNVKDPRLAISWPLSVVDLSERDARQPFVTDAFKGVAGL